MVKAQINNNFKAIVLTLINKYLLGISSMDNGMIFQFQ